MTIEDYGSNRALASAGLQLVGGLLVATAISMAYAEGVRQPMTLALGTVGALYFLVSGGVRIFVGILSRWGGR